jgi:hypothetical protein
LINITNIPLLGSEDTIIVTDHNTDNPRIGLDIIGSDGIMYQKNI